MEKSKELRAPGGYMHSRISNRVSLGSLLKEFVSGHGSISGIAIEVVGML